MIPLDAPPNLIQQVYDRILAAIVDHSLGPGARIRQHDLAEKLGVSRQPVSHALHLLHRQGLVVESGRKGFEVAAFEGARVRQIYEVRAALDGLAARLAAERASKDAAGSSALRGALEACRGVDDDGALAGLIERDACFHQALYRLSGNPAIEETAAPQWPHVRRAMAAVLMDPDYRARAWGEHETIAERVLAGDADGAAAAAQAHALRAGRMIEERLRSTKEAA